MNIINPIISGAVRSIKSIKGILVIWVVTLFMVCLVAMPVKNSVNSVLGASMITEKLSGGINVDVLTDFGSNLVPILSSLGSGIFLLAFFGFLVNVFFNGGLFSTLRNGEEVFSSPVFFRNSGTCFWSFLVITTVMTLIIMFSVFIIFTVSLLFAGSGSTAAEGARYKAVIIAGIISIVILPVFLLVADYARVWQVCYPKSAGFKAIGIGFKQTFKHFFSSYPVMFVNMILQALFAWFVLKFVSWTGPQTGWGIFLLFLISQFLFILRILLRVWRYGSVTYLYERHPA